MLKALVDLFTNEGNCECCGVSCKTALCHSCQEELNEAFDNKEFQKEERYTQEALSIE
jgi:hypothetical protein